MFKAKVRYKNSNESEIQVPKFNSRIKISSYIYLHCALWSLKAIRKVFIVFLEAHNNHVR